MLALPVAATAGNLDGSSPGVGNAEAARLYAEANAYVSNMAEGDYSYAYLQFYWKRAQANIDRIRRVYPGSPTAMELSSGSKKLGRFDLEYFKTRVLYNLEIKQLGSFDDVNNAIFLYGLDENRGDALRDEALANILEVLSRRQRWGEALRFPVLDIHRPLLLASIFKVAAFYDQPEMVGRLMKEATAAERSAADFDAILAEAQARLGKPRSGLYAFVESHPSASVRMAALRGIIDREILIHRMEGQHIPAGKTIQTTHVVVMNLSLRDDVRAAAGRIFAGRPGEAAPLLAVYDASLGISPDERAPAGAHLAYLQFLADQGRLDEAASYAATRGLRGELRRQCDLKAIELEARAGDQEAAERLRARFAAAGSAAANEAALAEFRGRMDSLAVPLVARAKTFSDLPITDPCVMAIAVMEWSLTPNRSQRGATPWDAIVYKFAGGFQNLPVAKSAAVSDAASTVKPY